MVLTILLSRPSASFIIWLCCCFRETALALAKSDIKVFLACRNVDKGREAVGYIQDVRFQQWIHFVLFLVLICMYSLALLFGFLELPDHGSDNPRCLSKTTCILVMFNTKINLLVFCFYCLKYVPCCHAGLSRRRCGGASSRYDEHGFNSKVCFRI